MANLGEKVRNTLFDWIGDVLDVLGDTLSTILSTGIGYFFDGLAIWVGGAFDIVEDSIKPAEGYPDVLENWRNAINAKPPREQLFAKLAFGIGVIGSFISSYGSALNMKLQQDTLANARPNIPDQASLLQGYYKGTMASPDVRDRFHKWGFNDSDIDALIATHRPPLAPEFYIQHWLRFGTNPLALAAQLGAIGYNEQDIEILKRLAFYIPPPQDLIHMAVREAFTPEIAEQFGQYEQFPPAFAEWAEKIGISEEWAKAYWAAHWELPSVQMGFEMLHRRIIDADMLDKLLRAADVMPFWREKLTQISYNPYTRVDIRRMYGAKVLTAEQVYDAYLDIGYDDAHARKLQEFTIRSQKVEDKELSKAEILKAYRQRVFSESETRTALTELGYDEQEVGYYMAIEASAFAEEQEKLAVDLLETQFKAGQIDITGLRDGLGRLGLPANQINLIVAKAELQGTAKTLQPTKEDIIRWYKQEQIDSGEAESYLSAMGFDSKYIDLYLSEIPRTPSVGIVIRWLNKGLIDTKKAGDYLKALDYAKAEIDILIAEATATEETLGKLPTLATIKRWYQTKRIPEQDAIDYLTALGYGERERNRFMAEWLVVEE